MPKKIKIKKDVAERQIDPVKYTDDEILYRDFLLNRIQNAYDEREAERKEFDGMTYSQYFKSNKESADSYIRPKTNIEDTNIVTGTTQGKCRTLLSIFLSFNYSPNIQAEDIDDYPQVEFGNIMESIVNKTRELEDDKDKKRLRWKELIDQGDVFVEEYFREESAKNKKLQSKFTGKIDIKWEERLGKALGKAETRIVSGINFYPGNIYNYYLCEQPYIYTIELMPRVEAQVIYGEWDRWKNVPYSSMASTYQYKDEYAEAVTLVNEDKNYVEIIKYQDKWNNEFMIMINGVMMLPIRFPLTEVSPCGDYSITKGSLFPLSAQFFYSKSIPSDTKVLQAVNDEYLKLMIWKTQYSFRPSFANNTGRQLSNSIFRPGTIHDKVDSEKLQPIIANMGVSSSEYNMFALIKGLIDENSFSQVVQGLGIGKSGTATEAMQMQRQSMNMIGIAILGVIILEEELVWKRIYTIISKYSDNEYIKKLKNRLTVEENVEDGRKGIRIIEFNEEKANQPSELTMVEENIESDLMQKPVRLTYLNPKKLKETLEWNYSVKIVPTPENTNELRELLFRQMVGFMMQIAPERVNKDYVLSRAAMLSKEDPDKILLKQEMAKMNPMDALMVGKNPMGGQDKNMEQQMLNSINLGEGSTQNIR